MGRRGVDAGGWWITTREHTLRASIEMLGGSLPLSLYLLERGTYDWYISRWVPTSGRDGGVCGSRTWWFGVVFMGNALAHTNTKPDAFLKSRMPKDFRVL